MRDVYSYFSSSGAYCSYTAVLTIHEHSQTCEGVWHLHWRNGLGVTRGLEAAASCCQTSWVVLSGNPLFYQKVRFWGRKIMRSIIAAFWCLQVGDVELQNLAHLKLLNICVVWLCSEHKVIPSSSVNYLAGLLPPAPTKLTNFNSKSQLWKLHPGCASKLDINQLVSSSGPLLISASSASGSEYFLIHIVPSGLTSPCSPL